MGSNPLMDVFRPQPSRGNNPMEMVAEFRRFAQGMTPQGAQQQVQQLLQSGRMSQQQFQELQRQAKSFMDFLGIK